MTLAIVTVINLKGGAGKTLVSASLASQWATRHVEEEGKGPRPLRVLAVDLDPQASLLEWSGKSTGGLVPVVGLKEGNLRDGLRLLAPNYDVVVIDTPPQLEGAAGEALMVCSAAVVPVAPGATDMWAMNKTLRAIHNARSLREFGVYGILNKADRRRFTTLMAKDVADMGLVFLDTWVRNYDDHPSAMVEGLSAVDFAPGSNAALDIRHLASELGRHVGIA